MRGRRALACLVTLPLLAASGCGEPDARALTVYCAAGLQRPVSELAQTFTAAGGPPVELRFGGSGTLLTALRAAGGAAVFLAADASFVERARDHGLVAAAVPLCSQAPALAVAAGNPERVVELADLGRPGLRVGVGSPEAAAIGTITRDVLRGSGLGETVRPTLVAPTVTGLVNALKLGSIDAAVIWDALATQSRELETVPAPELEDRREAVTAAVLRSPWQTEATAFCQFLASPETGLPVFERHGFGSLPPAP